MNKFLLLLVINVGAIVPAFGTCVAPRNPIEAENCLPGTPSSVWYIADAGSPNIQGFTTDISVSVGQSLFFKIKTSALAYRIDVYRIGFYQGNGARLVATVLPSAPLPQTQPTCLTDSAVGLTDCGNWAVSASWAVPNNATSGIYFARLVRLDTGEASPILFVVRNDASHSDILAQSSDTTWHAYNDYGGSSLYTGPISRAYKVSYNRPFNVPNGYTWFFSAEYPMVRWLEANGYDVSYSTGVDTDRRGALITQHRVFMSIGHDEYWSGGQRSNVEAARAAGVNLAFFSGNEVFWKTRWESSIDGSNTPYRTLVCYKETNADSVIDPADPPTWTGTWRDPRFSPPADGGRPENALTGTVFWVNSVRRDAITVPQADGRMRFWRNTSIASLAPGQVGTLPTGVLGYEWDVDADNGFRPAGLVPLSTTTLTVSTYLLDYGHTFGAGTATHHLTLYRAPSGALVFGAGTVQWSWGLDNTHSIDNVTPIDPNMRQATVNLLADMGVQPATLQAGLVPATSSTDITPPISTIISPASGSTVTIGSTVTVSGSAVDSGGVVGAVEISVDGGKTWHRAVGRENWNYSFTVGNTGSLSVQSRAVDDSGNIEVPGPGITLVTPLSVSTTSLPNGTQSVAYNQSLAAAGGTTPYSWSLISGALPAGLSLSSGGQISGTPTTTGTSNFTVQVTDASTPVQTATRALSITIVAASGGCPCTIWPSTAVPSVADVGPDSPVELGVTFRADSNGYITGIRFYKSTGNTGTHVGNLWSSGGALLASATFTGESASGWQQVNFSNPVAITANTLYVASYHTTIGHYSVTGSYFATTGVDNAPLHAPVNSSSTPNGPYAYGSTSTFPRNTYNSANYWVDVVFNLSVGPTPLSVSTTSLPNGTQSVAYNQSLAAAGGKTPYSWSLISGALPAGLSLSSGGQISGTPTTTGTSNFTVQVTDASTPVQTATRALSITIVAASGGCPCTIWPSTAVPSVADVGPDSPVELGVTFRADSNGYITGIRFYKSTGNTGTHVGNLWSSGGALLASATFTGESASGWQQVNFSNPVAITANTFYVASYHVSGGHWSANWSYFATSGVDNPPLHAPANGSGGVPNGRYAYGSASAFPTNTNSANYWVDVVFNLSVGPTPLSVSTTSLPNGTQSVAYNQSLAAAGGTTPYSWSLISGALPAGLSLSSGGQISGTPTTTGTSNFTVQVTDASTPVQTATRALSITIVAASGGCPCTIWPSTAVPSVADVGPDSPVELGVTFRADSNGYITGIRFYKSTGNTGTHVGNLWSSGGALLASATFTGESASGWQQVNFSNPVAITANTLYVASYHTTIGHYSVTGNYFATTGVDNAPLHAPVNSSSTPNGPYAYGSTSTFPRNTYNSANYWVDVVFNTSPH